MSEVVNDRLYFRQLLSGRDFAVNDQVASQMVNFVYLIGDLKTESAWLLIPPMQYKICCKLLRLTK